MPTPSDSTAQLTASSVPDDFSGRTTCPPEPEVERLPTWRDSPGVPAADEGDSHNPLSPASAHAHAMLAQSNDGIARSNPDRKRANTVPGSSIQNMAKPDEDAVTGRLSPSGEPLRSPRQTSSITAPSTTSLLSYEFSNVRVGQSEDPYRILFINTLQSSCRTTLRPSYGPAASSWGPSNRTVKYTMSMWRLSMSIWLNPISVVTYAYKVCNRSSPRVNRSNQLPRV